MQSSNLSFIRSASTVIVSRLTTYGRGLLSLRVLPVGIVLSQVPCVANAYSKIDIIQVCLDTHASSRWNVIFRCGPFFLSPIHHPPPPSRPFPVIKWQRTPSRLAQLPLETDINVVSDATPRRGVPSGQRVALYTLQN